jgi:capsular exopolysaccharide synthesis family protein
MGLGAGPTAVQGAMTGADVWRVIRSNLWLIIAVLLVSAALGYGINTWLAKTHSRFTSTGLIQVRSNDLSIGLDTPRGDMVNVEQEQATQTALLLSERLLSNILDSSDAIRQTDWFKQFIFYKNGQQLVDAEAAKADLLDHLAVVPVVGSRVIKVQMSYSVPKDCQTIVQEIVDQHIKNEKSKVNTSEVERNNSLEQLKLNYDGQIHEKTERMTSIAAKLGAAGVGVFQGPSSKDFELQALVNEQLRTASFLGAAEAKLRTFEKQMETNSAPELEEALQRSPLYSQYRHEADDAQSQLNDLSASQGTQNPRALLAKRRLDTALQRMADTENDIKSRTAELIRANLANDRTAAEQAVHRIEKRVQEIRFEIADLARERNDYERLSAEVTNLHTQLEHVKDQQDKIGYIYAPGKWAPVEWATFPDLPDHPTFPRLPVTLSLAIMIGLALSLGIAFLREITDTTVRTPRDIARVGQLMLLGMIPHENDDPQAAGARLPLAIFEAPHSIIAEQFRQLRTRLQHTASLDTTRSILVTGCSAEDGVTTVAVNLASGLALNGRRILLVDANFRRPSLHNIFQANNDLGFGDVLNDLGHFQDAVHETEVPNLSVIMAGAKPSNPTELLESQLLIDFIERALEEYDHVIFDSGPLLMVSDSSALAPRVDGVVTVVRARGNSRGMLGRMRDELRRLKSEHLGVVLNAVRVHGGGYYAMMIKNYYAYQNG